MMIGRHKYEHLKSLKFLTEEQKKQILDYENSIKPKLSKEQIEKTKEYQEKLKYLTDYTEWSPTTTQLWEFFEAIYLAFNGVKFELNEKTKANLRLLLCYFSDNKKFLESDLISKKLELADSSGEVKIRETTPSLKKGLLVIGNKGVSKTSSFKAFSELFRKAYTLGRRSGRMFKYVTLNQVYAEYDSCETPAQKKAFFNKYTKGTICFDDVKTKVYSQYKVNVFKDIIEMRNDNKVTTHMLMNFADGSDGDTEAAIIEYGMMYGGRAYDRLYSDNNIITFKGESMRK